MSDWIYTVTPGVQVEVRTAFGEWVPAVADSRVEGTHIDGRKVHDFPIMWVLVRSGRVIPWPIDAIRPVSEPGGAER